jgi:antitoxin MazE
MKVKIAKWGNSLGLRLPRAAIEATGLKAGAEVDVIIEGRDLRVRSFLPAKYYRLEDLVAEMKRLGPENESETVNWGPDRGSEIIDDAYSRGEVTLEDILTGKAKEKAEAFEKAKGKKDAS